MAGVVGTWNQTADLEGGDDSDFDTVSPDWDNEADAEAGDESDWDSVVENGSSTFNNAAGSALRGTRGWEITIDASSSTAKGVWSTNPTNETHVVLEFTIDPNSMTMTAGDTFTVAQGVSAGSVQWAFVNLAYDGTNYEIEAGYRTDGGSKPTTSNYDISDAVTYVRAIFDASSSGGADDGTLYLYLDGQLKEAVTGIDNDTMDVDQIEFGACAGIDAGSASNTFHMDDCRWSDGAGSPPWIIPAAQMGGSYGSAFTLYGNSTSQYEQLSDPTTENDITAEFDFDPNSLTMADLDTFQLLIAPNEFRVDFRINSGTYQCRVLAFLDSGNTSSSWHSLSDAPQTIRVVWRASSGAGKDDGWIALYIDGTHQETVDGLDNDTLSVDEIRFGGVSGLDAGTSGVFYLDDIKWYDEIVDLRLDAGNTPSGTIANKAIQFLVGALTPTSSLVKKVIQTLSGSLTPSGVLRTQIKKVISMILDVTIAAIGALIKSPVNEDK